MVSKKNTIILNNLLLVCLAIIMSAASCDPEPVEPDNKTIHRIKNNTTQDLIIYITPPVSSRSDSVFYCPKGINTIIVNGGFSSTSSDVNPFNALFNWRDSCYYTHAYLYLKDSVLVKTWNKFYTESELKQFFRETDWIYESYTKPNDGYKYHDYTFEILPGDLNLK